MRRLVNTIPTAGEIQHNDYSDPGEINEPQRVTTPIGQTSIPEMSKVQILPGMSGSKKNKQRNAVYQEYM